ncbi:unannotated protein [freshwater metagenome]|uniref:Unannotated protein n=1 Tax=freshwater metagenome TaxID=449393 RepID=A0A6J6ZDY5_9ZZZZ
MRTGRRCRSRVATSSHHSIFLTLSVPTLFVGISFHRDSHGHHGAFSLTASAKPHAKRCSHSGMCFRSLPPMPTSTDGSPTRKQLRPRMSLIAGSSLNSTTPWPPSPRPLRVLMPSAVPVESRNSSTICRTGTCVAVGPASGSPVMLPLTPRSTSASPPFLRCLHPSAHSCPTRSTQRSQGANPSTSRTGRQPVAVTSLFWPSRWTRPDDL